MEKLYNIGTDKPLTSSITSTTLDRGFRMETIPFNMLRMAHDIILAHKLTLNYNVFFFFKVRGQLKNTEVHTNAKYPNTG